MNHVRMHGTHLLLAAVALGAAACSDSGTAPVTDVAALSRSGAPAAASGEGAVYTMTNATAGDRYPYTLETGTGSIGGFAVGPNGTLTPAGTVTAGPASGGLQGVAAC